MTIDHPRVNNTGAKTKISYSKLQVVSFRTFWEELQKRIPEANITALESPSDLKTQLFVSKANHTLTMLTDVLFMGSRAAGELIDDATIGGTLMASLHKLCLEQYPGKGKEIGEAIDAASSRIATENVIKEINDNTRSTNFR